MSSFFDDPRDMGRFSLADLLDAVAAEWRAIGHDVANLGALVSGVTVVSDAQIGQFQAFDSLSQSAHAQAKVIAAAADFCREGPLATAQIMTAVDRVPLPAMRHRLRLAALGHTGPMPDEDDDIVWLDDETAGAILVVEDS